MTEILRDSQEIYATRRTGQLTIRVKLRGRDLRIILDCGADGNYISPTTIARINIPIIGIMLYELQVVDDTRINYNSRVIDQGIVPSEITTEDRYIEEVQFDIAPIRNY